MTRRPRFWRFASLHTRVDRGSTSKAGSRTSRERRLRIEPLEDRRLLAVFSVDNLNDAGAGSLRQAIDDANTAAGADVIEFEAGLSGTIALLTGEMLMTDDLTIDGPGAETLTIDAQQNSRIFHITGGSGPVTIEGLTLTGGDVLGNGGAISSETRALLSIASSTISGNSATSDAFGYGGGIFSAGELTITASTILNNSVSGVFVAAGGGAVALDGLAVADSEISGNSATAESSGSLGFGYGGGIGAIGNVTVTGSTVSDNLAMGTDIARGGGVLAFFGTATISDSTISGNSANSDTLSEYGRAYGAGINASYDLTVSDSMISDNSASGRRFGFGGGLQSTYGNVSVTGSTISDNSATANGQLGVGGGIAARLGDVAVVDTTISDNTATNTSDAGGGGVFAFNGDMTILNSTVSGNSATGGLSPLTELGVFGGGVGSSGEATISGSTITGNSVTRGPFGVATGGGIWGDDDAVTIENSIVAGNQTLDGTAPDLLPGSGPLTVRYSLIGDNTDTGLAEAPVGMPDANGNLIGDPTGAGIIDPMLEPLQDYGGPTFTHALAPGSPAINAGDPGFLPPPEFDQRGDPFVRVFDGRLDMGAFEAQPADLDEQIQQLLDDGVLNRGQANALLAKLNENGTEQAQINRLQAFINQVNALVQAGILTSAEGQSLIDGAESLINMLAVDLVLPLVVETT